MPTPLLHRARLASLALAALVVLGCPDPNAPKSPGTPGSPGPTPKPIATPTPAPSPYGGQLTVTWYAFYQRDIQYFEVYRSDTPDGPWKRVSNDDEPIYGEGYSEERLRYDFVDRTVKPGQVYYYYIGKVSLTGRRSRHTLGTLKSRGMTIAEANAKRGDYGPDRPETATTNDDTTTASAMPTPATVISPSPTPAATP